MEVQNKVFLWIWNIKNIGTPDVVISKLKDLNIDDVCIKYHDGRAPMNFKSDFLEYMPALKRAGIRVGAWGYNYFNSPDSEADLVIDSFRNGADYYIFDAEIEVEGKVQQTENVLQQVRKSVPKARLGYAPFPYANLHSSYPYEVFDKYCDFASPQLYWQTIGDPVDISINKMVQSFKAKKLKLPIYPSIQSYKQQMDDYKKFCAMYKEFGLWDLDSMDSNCRSFLNTINISSKNMPTEKPKPQIDQKVLYLQKVLNNLKICDQWGAVLAEDGMYGPRTQSAVKRFQSIVGIMVDGIAGPITWSVLNSILAKPLTSKGSKGSVVRYIQYRVGVTIDGIFGQDTEDGVRVFQNRFGCRQIDGVVGPETWGKLIG